MPVPESRARTLRRRRLTLATVVLATISLMMPAGALARLPDINVQLLAINDFHGNLEPPGGSSGRVGSNATDQGCIDAPNCELAGGIAYLADDIKDLEATNPNTLVVSAGDNIGASPLISAAFHDEPTIEALNMIGMDVAAVGNHEFDEGVTELLRMQNGGCHPTDGCDTGHTFAGADFDYLAANVVDKTSGQPILPAVSVKEIGGTKIGFIGLTLEGTPLIVSANGIQTVNFLDEAKTINRYAKQLRESGVNAIVVLIHEGGAQSVGLAPDTINGCTGMSGAIVDIVHHLRQAVDLVISGHTHTAYNCQLPNREEELIPVTSSSSFGRLVTEIDMSINPKNGNPRSISVNNHIVFRDDADPAVASLVSNYQTVVAPIANRVVGNITANITRTNNANGESQLGDVISDAQLEYTQSFGAQLAFMNPGGIRTDLQFAQQPVLMEGDGVVTYGEIFAVQPFNNLVVTQDMTGQQIKDVLEQSWAACTPVGRSGGATVILQTSATFKYTYNDTLPCGSRITSMLLNGSPLSLTTTYKVTANNFLADGGDSFPAFAVGTNRQFAPAFDVDALEVYIAAHSPVPPGPQNRITKVVP